MRAIILTMIMVLAPFAATFDTVTKTTELNEELERQDVAQTLSNTMLFSDVSIGSLWNQTNDPNNISSYMLDISPTEFFFAHHHTTSQNGVGIGVINISTGIVWSQHRSIDKDSLLVTKNNHSIIIVANSLSPSSNDVKRTSPICFC